MNIEQRLSALEKRLEQTEAELEIRNLIVRYCLAVDCGNTQAALGCHTSSAIYVVSAPTSGRENDTLLADATNDLKLVGHTDIAAMLDSPLHRSLLPNCAHTVGPIYVDIQDNQASAVGYSRLYRKQEDTPQLMRLSINEFRFQREQGVWLISYRESRLVGSQEAQQILRGLTEAA
jgi:hypothetical protein